MTFFKKILFVLVPVIFFLIALHTLYDYGMNWDSSQHFSKGQAFFRFLTTGKKDYKGLPAYCTDKDNMNSSFDYKTKVICNRFKKQRVSEYESYILDFNWALGNVYGHPPFGDEMLALFNQIFFVWLGWVEDVPAYHLYGIFCVFLSTLFISYWLKKTYGTFAAIIGGFSLYLYPLLLGEQHFNVKDPALAAWFIIAIGLFYFAVRKKSPFLMILSAIAGGFSFGTKINFIFAPVILFPWLIFYLFTPIKKIIKKNGLFTIAFLKQLYKNSPKALIISILFYPIIIAVIFFGTLPSFWFDPSGTLSNLYHFYTDVGVSTCAYAKLSPQWFLQCTNSYALLFFIYSTPLITLFYLGIGMLVGIKEFKKFGYLPVLLLSFLLVTLLRVTFSIAAIYGGVRQILEFIGPLCMLSAIGAVFFRDVIISLCKKIFNIRKKAHERIVIWVISVLLVLGFVPISIKMIQMHPNENIYMNPIIGGVKGAVAQNIPGAGNTYGNVYYIAAQWLDVHATKDAKVALLFGLGQNVSRTSLRPDLWYYKGYLPLSGYHQYGEYVISLINQDINFSYTFRYKFFNNYVKPIHEIKSDGITLLKIWKNDPVYLLPNVQISSEKKEDTVLKFDGKNTYIMLPKVERLKRLEIYYPQKACDAKFLGATVSFSQDGESYEIDHDALDDFTSVEIAGYSGDRIYLFAGDKAKTIRITAPDNYSCNISEHSYSLYVLPN